MDRQRNILTHVMISEALKWAATDMGHKASDYASHSLRIGGATALKAAGWDDESIRRFGRWASDCWRRYVYSPRSDRRRPCMRPTTSQRDEPVRASLPGFELALFSRGGLPLPFLLWARGFAPPPI